MASIDEDPFGAPVRKKIIHELGENLARLEAAAEAKEASRRAADAFFKA